jgi:tight adherence protein C
MTPVMILGAGLGFLFVSGTLALSIVGVATSEKRAVGRSLAAINAINSAPEPLRKELDKPFAERVLVPLGKRMLGLGRRLTPDDTAQRLRKSLDIAGNPPGWDVDRVVGFKMLGFFGLLGFSIAYCLLLGLSTITMLLLGVAAALLGYFSPNIWLYNLGSKREANMRREIADALDLLTISVEAGLGFDSALGRVARNSEGALAEEFARILQEMQLGVGRSEALRAVGDRTNVVELRSFVSAMVQADAFGIPIGQVLRVQSKEMRVKRRQLAEEKAQKVPVKILLPLIGFILPTLFIVIIGPAVPGIMGAFSGTGG